MSLLSLLSLALNYNLSTFNIINCLHTGLRAIFRCNWHHRQNRQARAYLQNMHNRNLYTEFENRGFDRIKIYTEYNFYSVSWEMLVLLKITCPWRLTRQLILESLLLLLNQGLNDWWITSFTMIFVLNFTVLKKEGIHNHWWLVFFCTMIWKITYYFLSCDIFDSCYGKRLFLECETRGTKVTVRHQLWIAL